MPHEIMSMRGLLRRLRWTVLRPLAHRANGDERSRRSGPGIEFAHVREYQPGDDVRRIDWQLTARSDRTYVREAHDERGLDIWLAVDVSPWLRSDAATRSYRWHTHAAGQNAARSGTPPPTPGRYRFYLPATPGTPRRAR